MAYFLERLGGFINRWFFSIVGTLLVVTMFLLLFTLVELIRHQLSVILDVLALLVSFLTFSLLLQNMIEEITTNLRKKEK